MGALQRWQERDLLRRVRDGDREAADQLVDQHYQGVFRWLLHLCRDPERAADLTQETLLHVWEGIGGFRGDSSLKTWIHRIAYHAFLRAHAQRGPELLPLTEAEEQSSPACLDPDGCALSSALAQIPQEQRHVVVLHYLQGLTCAEIAGVMEIPLGTVLSRLHGARSRLRALLSEDGSSPSREEVRPHVASE